MPECPVPLTIKDLLNELGAQIIFDENKVRIHIPQNNVPGRHKCIWCKNSLRNWKARIRTHQGILPLR